MIKKIFILTALTLCFGLPRAYGTLLLDDGQVHDISRWISDDIEVRDDAFSGGITTVNVLTNAFCGIRAYERSIVNVFGGNVCWLSMFDSSELNIYDGKVGHPAAGTSFFCSSVVNIFGGYIIIPQASMNSVVTISGGTVEHYMSAKGNSTITVSGGNINTEVGIGAYGDGSINFIGTDFAIDGMPVDYGQWFGPGGEYEPIQGIRTEGTLTGTLANGQYLDSEFRIYEDASISLVQAPIPEPATILLLGLGALFLKRRRRK